MPTGLDRLETLIDYHFADPALLQAAVTHRSFSNEHPVEAPSHNERLEYLGDAVLGLVVSDELCRRFPRYSEGELTRLRAEAVNAVSLAEVARGCVLRDCLRLGRGEERSGGRDKESLLADALEALIGAVFADGGWEAGRRVTVRLLGPLLQQVADGRPGRDHKTRLQEQLQGERGRAPVYVLTGCEGPDHERLYHVEVRFEGSVIGRGTGRTKKAAEQAAAQQALAVRDGAAATSSEPGAHPDASH